MQTESISSKQIQKKTGTSNDNVKVPNSFIFVYVLEDCRLQSADLCLCRSHYNLFLQAQRIPQKLIIKCKAVFLGEKLINNQVLLVQITASPPIVRTMHLLERSLIEYSKKKSFYNPWNDGGFPYSMGTLAKQVHNFLHR